MYQVYSEEDRREGEMVPRYRSMILILGASSPHLELKFRIRQSPVAQRWAALAAEFLHTGGIRERERFVNFSPDVEMETASTVKNIKELTSQLSVLYPHIEFGEIDFSRNIQAEVNRLHVSFADRHLVNHDLTEASVSLWSKLNCELHHMEALDRRKFIENMAGVRNAFINLTFSSDGSNLPLTGEDFSEDVLYRNFGTCYLGYSQAGRHIMELFYSNDLELPKEHVQPFRMMSADTRIWFGHAQGHTNARQLERDVEKWFNGEASPLFQSLGMKWDPVALGTHEIPVAYLEEPIYTKKEIEAIQREVHERS